MKLVVVSLCCLVACGFEAPNATSGDDVGPTPATVGFEAASSSADEMATGFTVDVVLAPASDGPVTVGVAVSGGTATPTADFALGVTTLTFAPGETRQSIPVTFVADGTEEDAETIQLALSGATGANLGNDAHEITISNDILPRVRFATAASNAPEGGSANVVVTLDKAPTTEATVHVLATTTQASASDYTFADDVTVTFGPGETMKTLPLAALQDTLDEDVETVALELAMPSANLLIEGTTMHLVSLVDDDLAPTVAFTMASASAAETGAHSAVVRLSTASGKTVTVPYTVTSTATANDDFVVAPSPLTFAPGETEKSVAINIMDDNLAEDAETVTVTLTAPADGTATLGMPAQHVFTINANDTPALGWRQLTGSIFELEFTYELGVLLTNPSTKPVTVAIRVGAMTSAEGDDYDLLTTSVTFAPGETERFVQFHVEGDSAPEQTDVVYLELVTPTNAVLDPNRDVRTVTILNDDD